MPEYLSIEQLAARTPWSVEAIYRMIRRNILRRGAHYFQPQGPRTHLIFKWSAIVAFVETNGQVAAPPGPAVGRATREGILDVEPATAALQRLHH